MTYTPGCFLQEGARLLSFRFFLTISHLIKTPTFINFSQSCQKRFLCIKDRRQYLSCVLRILAVVSKDAIALYLCFEAIVQKDTIVLHLYFEVSFYKWINLVTNVKHSVCLLLDLLFQYSYHG